MSFIRKRYCRPGRASALTRRHVGGRVLDEVLPHRLLPHYRDQLPRMADVTTGVTTARVLRKSCRQCGTEQKAALTGASIERPTWQVVVSGFISPSHISCECFSHSDFTTSRHYLAGLPQTAVADVCRQEGLRQGHNESLNDTGAFYRGRGGDWFWHHE